MADTFAGRILLREWEPHGWVTVEGGRVLAWGRGQPPEEPRATGWIVPAPVNAHTHVADAWLRDEPGKPDTVAQLFGPDGWKNQRLASGDPSAMAAGAERYADEMAAVGTTAFLDFREGGAPGVRWLRDLELPVRPVVLGRPARGGADEREVEAVLDAADGVGLSGVRDMRARDIEAWAEACHERRKPFGIHVSEDARDDMDLVLSWQPTFVVHMTQARSQDLEDAADARLPVVVCPRSNARFGWTSPVAAMLEAGCTVAVGTDNGMLQDGDLWAELALLRRAAPDAPVADLLRMATYHGRDLAGLPDPLPPARGQPLDAVVLPADPVPTARRRKPVLAINPDLPPLGGS